MSWKVTALAGKAQIEAALATAEADQEWDEAIILTAFEPDPAAPARWRLEAYLDEAPGPARLARIAGLFAGSAPALVAEELPDADWVIESQKGLDPIRAGRFHVHTPDHPPGTGPGLINFCIPAAQAFGTGQHATTAGCLEMLDTMKRAGLHPRNIADIGTGTGLLAFAAHALWPAAQVVASDIDPLCAEAVIENAARNRIPLGTGRGAIAALVAEGIDEPALIARAPYDLLIANILAGPLISLASDFAFAVAPRGGIVLAGLLVEQEARVLAAYGRAGFHLRRRLHRGDWSILWLRRRSGR